MRSLDNRSRNHMRMPLGFRLWFGFVGTLVLATFLSIGALTYWVGTDPQGAGQFIGRIIGGAISGAKEPR